MDMRRENKWVSFGMSAKRWVEATDLYNSRLIQQRMSRRLSTIPKNPRALFEKLGDVESQILERLATSNFRSKHIPALSSDSDRSTGACTGMLISASLDNTGVESEFWRTHCYAVPLIKAGSNSSDG